MRTCDVPFWPVFTLAAGMSLGLILTAANVDRLNDRLDRLEQRPAVVQHTVVTHDVSAPRASRSAPRVVRPLIGPRRAPTPETSLDWAALAQCESSGDPRAVSPSGRYEGLYQFDLGTWRSVGGTGHPKNATPAEQTKRARLLYADRGRSPWPVCGVRL